VGGDEYLSAKPMRLLRRKSDRTPVVAALVPEETPDLARDEIELVLGPGFPKSFQRGRVAGLDRGPRK
jgi:hypothetical protein